VFLVRGGFFIFVIFQIIAIILNNKTFLFYQNKDFIIKIEPPVNSKKSKFKRYFSAIQTNYNQLKKINV
tara:strand:+ start:10632 stop:10838 length:207 start_codon:yes stop_codon:yes gene_type:complete